MIKNWYITGDTHGNSDIRVNRLLSKNPDIIPEETALIILGDSGFNYYLDKGDYKRKKHFSKRGILTYCVRGNHEERPQNIEGMELIEDENVNGLVYIQKEFPLIRYFVDGQKYDINGYKVLVIGGAYSVDKFYRLRNQINWFEQEQLSNLEMSNIGLDLITDLPTTYDFVLTHTCPYSWQPRDLFLNGIDQSLVDNTMEIWMDRLKDCFDWKIWMFGHYHDDRLVRPKVEMMYYDIQSLDEVYEKWFNPEKAYEIALSDKDPNYNMGV